VSAAFAFVLGCGIGSTIGSLATAFSLALFMASKQQREHDDALIPIEMASDPHLSDD
jgi:hypothetical protein